MLKLITMYYSLSDQVGVECKKDENHILAGNELKLLTEKWNRICRDITYKNNDFFSPNEFLIKLEHHLNGNLS